MEIKIIIREMSAEKKPRLSIKESQKKFDDCDRKCIQHGVRAERRPILRKDPAHNSEKNTQFLDADSNKF